MRLKGDLPELRAPRGRVLWIALLTALAALSLVQGFENAYARSQDFQWSGARMLLAHIDPWAEYLRGDPQHRIFLSQIPNYLPVLYVLLLPFGLLPAVPAAMLWAVVNVLFSALSAWLTGRFFSLGRFWTFALACLLLMSTPARQTIGNGQQGLFVLFLWCISLLSVRLSDARAAAAGISYFKFNFAPAIAIYLFFRGGLRAVFFSVLPSVVATVGFWLWLTGGKSPRELLSLVTEPLTVSRTGYFPSGGDPNLMDVLQAAVFHHYAPSSFLVDRPLPLWVAAFTFGVALVICISILAHAFRRRGPDATGWQLALMAASSVVLFKHHPYDSVVLLLPMAYALPRWERTAAKLALLGIAYAWFLQKAAEVVLPPPTWKYLFFFEFSALALALAALFRIGATETSRSLLAPTAAAAHA